MTTALAEPVSQLDSVDKDILNRIQGEFPISADPYGDIGRAVGISAEEALRRVTAMVGSGVVRKVGPFFDARKMDYTSTLCALDVPEERLEEVASVISSYREVTHNYLREGRPNVWFTLIAPSKEDIARITGEITKRTGVGPVRNLPAAKMFKVKVDLKVSE